MFEGIVAYFLSRLLGEYFEGISKENIKFSLSGDLLLRNLVIKRSLIDSWGFPASIRSGFVSQFRLVVPWTSLNSKPSILELDDVYIILRPHYKLGDYSNERAEALIQENKQRLLKVWEMTKDANAHAHDPEIKKESTDSDQTFAQRIFAKILRNLQLYIRRIHIRYEDDQIDPDRPFAVGITLAQVERENEGGKIDKHSPIISKVVRLTDLAVYWDTNNYPLKFDTLPDMCAQMKDLIYTEENKVKHGFMLSPMSGHIKIDFNKDKSNTSLPQYSTEINIDAMDWNWDEIQFADNVNIGVFWDKHFRQIKYRKYRPPNAEINSKNLWDFAIDCVRADRKEKTDPWRWENIKKKCALRKEYIEIYKKKKMKKKWDQEQKKRLEELEKILTYEDIALYRCLSNATVRYQKELKKGNWFTGMFSSKDSKQKKQQLLANPPPMILKPEERREIFYLYGIDFVDSKQGKPTEILMYKMDFFFKRLSFNLFTENQKPIGSLLMKNFKSFSNYYQQDAKHKLELKSAVLKDHFSKKRIMSRLHKKNKVLESEVDVKNVRALYDYEVKMTIRPFKFVYNLEFLTRVVNFWVSPKTKYNQERMEGRQRRREEFSTIYTWSVLDLLVAKPTVVLAPASIMHRTLNNSKIENVPLD
jgi:vacuolar protein sorting-associated protein 13A/C